MNWYEIVLGIVLIITSLALIAIVLFQEGRSAGLSGAIAGGAETFLGKNKSRTVEQKLVRTEAKRTAESRDKVAEKQVATGMVIRKSHR